jgi:hypothetical protein
MNRQFPQSSSRDWPGCANNRARRKCVVRKPEFQPAKSRRKSAVSPKRTPTLTQLAERANALWQSEGCPAAPELIYWKRAWRELQRELTKRWPTRVASWTASLQYGSTNHVVHVR